MAINQYQDPISVDDVKDYHNMPVPIKTGSSRRHGHDNATGESLQHGSSDSPILRGTSQPHNECKSDRTNDIVTSSTTPEVSTSPGTARATTNPATAGQAARLKRSFSIAMGQNPSGTMKVLAEHDPENHEIKRLREEGYKWSEIAERLNKQRVAAGKVPGLTDNAVYSRYTRNAPRIAAAQGEVWDPTTIGPHPSKKTEPMAPITGFNDLEDQLLVEAYAEIQKETWELVSERIVAKGGKRHDPELCARRYQSI